LEEKGIVARYAESLPEGEIIHKDFCPVIGPPTDVRLRSGVCVLPYTTVQRGSIVFRVAGGSPLTNPTDEVKPMCRRLVHPDFSTDAR
jgi:hypothetical protein